MQNFGTRYVFLKFEDHGPCLVNLFHYIRSGKLNHEIAGYLLNSRMLVGTSGLFHVVLIENVYLLESQCCAVNTRAGQCYCKL